MFRLLKERNRRRRECTEKEKRKKREDDTEKQRQIKKRGERENLPNARQNSSVIQECFIVFSLQMKKGERGLIQNALISGRAGFHLDLMLSVGWQRKEEEEGRTIGEGSIEVFLLSPNELASRALEYMRTGPRENILNSFRCVPVPHPYSIQYE